MKTYNIWRYDSTTPREEQPWVVSIRVDGKATLDPPCFETADEAIRFVAEDGYLEW